MYITMTMRWTIILFTATLMMKFHKIHNALHFSLKTTQFLFQVFRQFVNHRQSINKTALIFSLVCKTETTYHTIYMITWYLWQALWNHLFSQIIFNPKSPELIRAKTSLPPKHKSRNSRFPEQSSFWKNPVRPKFPSDSQTDWCTKNLARWPTR